MNILSTDSIILTAGVSRDQKHSIWTSRSIPNLLPKITGKKLYLEGVQNFRLSPINGGKKNQICLYTKAGIWGSHFSKDSERSVGWPSKVETRLDSYHVQKQTTRALTSDPQILSAVRRESLGGSGTHDCWGGRKHADPVTWDVETHRKHMKNLNVTKLPWSAGWPDFFH